MQSSPDKTGVSGSSPEWPTKATILEELPLRELLISLLGDDWRRQLHNRTRINKRSYYSNL